MVRPKVTQMCILLLGHPNYFISNRFWPCWAYTTEFDMELQVEAPKGYKYDRLEMIYAFI